MPDKPDAPPVTDLQRLRCERDLYRRLLELGQKDQLEPFLAEALGLVVEVTGAVHGFLEIRDEKDEATFSIAHGFTEDELADVRARISSGIVAQALLTGDTIQTMSALLDDRFKERKSVQAQKIEAVLCAPIGGAARRGVVYLQGRAQSGPFGSEAAGQVEKMAMHIAPLADRLLVRRHVDEAEDPTRELRAKYRLDGLVGRTPGFATALEHAMLAAPLDVNVLLTGQSGTGKSDLARAIHDNSPRRSGPFVEVNCGALPEGLVESELFGARAGSHSTAHHPSEGRVAAAESGTLFLDEVAELPYEAQAKLLQLLQSRRYYPLGSNVPRSANIRLIAATNRDLEQSVRERKFREDLFYRLQVLPIHMPALAQRRRDVPALAAALSVRIAERDGLPPIPLSAAALRALETADWPGNVRQLENAIEVGMIRAHGRRAIEVTPEHLFPERAPGEDDEVGRPLTYQEATHRFQKELVEKTLVETDGNVAAAARRLDLARSHLYNLMELFGLHQRHRRERENGKGRDHPRGPGQTEGKKGDA